MSGRSYDLRSAPVTTLQSLIPEVEIPGVLQIVFPSEGRFRSRKVVTRSRARRTYKYPSWKARRMAQCESSPELKFYRLLDTDPSVLSFYEQPFVVHYFLDGEWHVHFPDVLVERSKGCSIVEVKDAAGAIDSEVLRRTDFLASLFLRLGLTYRLEAVDDVRYTPSLNYSASVLRTGRRHISESEREVARCHFASKRELTWKSVLDGALGARGRNIVARLLLEGVVRPDSYANSLCAASVFSWAHSPVSSADFWGR